MNIKDKSQDYTLPVHTCRGKHADIFPKNIFCAIVGPAGSGKANLL